MAVPLASYRGALSTSAVTPAVEFLVACAGLLIGMAGAIWLVVDRRRVATLALTVVVGLGTMILLSVPGRSLPVGLAAGLLAPLLWWTRRPGSDQRALLLFDHSWRRQILGREALAPSWWWLGALAAIGSLVALCVTGGVWCWFVAFALAVVGSVLVVQGSGQPPPPTHGAREDVTLITVDHPDRIADTGSAIAVSSHDVSVAAWPPVVFRGFVGWNLGLGLDAEGASWAAQLAARVGLGELLAEPDFVLSTEQAFALSVCRAMAATSEVVVIEFDGGGVSPSLLRDLAGMVRETRAGRSVIVVCHGPEAGRRFVGRVRSAV